MGVYITRKSSLKLREELEQLMEEVPKFFFEWKIINTYQLFLKGYKWLIILEV